MAYKTEQEEFWSGEFGDEYIERNRDRKILADKTALLAKILGRMEKPASILEFGSNIGLNLKAVRRLLPDISCHAIEINHKAVEILRADPELTGCGVSETSILEYEPECQYDFVLISGVLIHINPEELGAVYDRLYASAKRYICTVDYYNPTPVMVKYRGKDNRLFKRDFAGEFMDRYPDVKLVDYGFQYHRDNIFPQDDCTWFLMEKPGSR